MSVTLDSSHLVYTGSACSACSKPGLDLSRCGACGSAFYCNRECQEEHFKAHKPQCKVFKLLRKLSEDMPEKSLPKDAPTFYLQRLNCRQMLEPMLKRKLSRSELRALMSEAKCSVCFRVRSQLADGVKLECCNRCGWGWACSEHARSYLRGPHKACCDTYNLLVTSEAALHAFFAKNGKLPGTTLQARRRNYNPLPSSWEAYFMWRQLLLEDVGLLCNLTKRLSQPLSILWALEKLIPREELSDMTSLTVHVLGASAFEIPAGSGFEELLHLLPSLRKLHIAFIGPELAQIMTEDSNQHTQKLTCCKPCIDARCTRTYSYHHTTYHEYVARAEAAAVLAAGPDVPSPDAGGDGLASDPASKLSKDMSALAVTKSKAGSGKKPLPRLWKAPDLAVAFNSGMYEEDRELWRPTLELLVGCKVRCLFTSYNKLEVEADAKAWKEAGGEIKVEPQLNPFQSQEPIVEPSRLDEFYYLSYYAFCG